MKHIVYLNEIGLSLATKIQSELKDFQLTKIKDFNENIFDNESCVVSWALGVCVRMIAPFIKTSILTLL